MIRLSGQVQQYAWGRGSDEGCVGKLAQGGAANETNIGHDKPYAEVPSSVSLLLLADASAACLCLYSCGWVHTPRDLHKYAMRP